jgi:iron(III) transport system permease protein
MSSISRNAYLVITTGLLALSILPWYGLPQSFWSGDWLGNVQDPQSAPALFQILLHGRHWLAVIYLALAVPLPALLVRRDISAGLLICAAAGGLFLFFLQGFSIGLHGWTSDVPASVFGPVGPQPGMGVGAFLTCTSLLLLLALGLARAGAMRGDIFLVSAVTVIVASILIFVFYPVANVLLAAAVDRGGQYSPYALAARILSEDIWSLGCLWGSRCGVAWNSLLLAATVGVTTALLGLAFALLHRRTGFRAKAVLRVLAVLPIITPPFVIGLGIILLFGRTGIVTAAMSDWLGIPPSRWIYGFFGLVIVQTLAFAPIGYLVLIGVVEGISPSMEEAASTLRAGRARVFRTVTFPLLKPGLANAFLIGFVESLADFGNPLVLGGNFDVLSTDIFFAIVGSQNDPGRAAALAIVLLALTLSAFILQRRWLGSRSYTTIAGKGDSGRPAPLPQTVKFFIYAAALPWLVFTAIVYAIILAGGFLNSLGIDNSFTFKHYVTAFGIEWTDHGILWTGRAWPSFWTTLQLAALAAPPTAAIGLLTAYLLDRQKFIGQTTFEFITMLSFAIPGTVIGVSYIFAFNVPPIELTGTGLILIICFVFRNLPVSIRAGMASLEQIDKSLDECSLTLRHGSFATIRRVILPLVRPAIVASLVYSFVRAITSVSAVIFLVSAKYNLATAYIVGRVEISDFGLAIAYSSVLVVLMMLVIGGIQLAVGEQRRPITIEAGVVPKREQFA